uniref:Calponin-homology (CH) domain-containing protein n=1 Tax=Glossina palpalis gambiensis TaxID=67801 RepID=A0A1B0BRU9_9MUSC
MDMNDTYNESFDDDMEAERDLAEDAQWKKIQQNTFTRWANEHLKTIDRSINNLETDLSDGLRLIALIEVLSQKRMPKYNKRPTFRSQKLENVSVALKFLEDEGIKIVNIAIHDMSYDAFEVHYCGLLQMQRQSYYSLTLGYGRVQKCANNIYEVMK